MRHFNCATAWGEREGRATLLQLELFLKQQCQNKMLKSRIMDFPLNMYHLFQRKCKCIGWLCVCLSCRGWMKPVLVSQAANRFVFPSHHNQSQSGHHCWLGNISKSWTFDYLILASFHTDSPGLSRHQLIASHVIWTVFTQGTGILGDMTQAGQLYISMHPLSANVLCFQQPWSMDLFHWLRYFKN